MSKGTATHVAFNTASQTALRILIASYFLAVALQIIPGTNLGSLFAPILPAPFNEATAAAIVFSLAFLLIAGVATRTAALIIALMTFYASYLAMVELGFEQELGSFWRDLALIAALLLTYSEPKMGSRRRRRIFHRTITPRRIDLSNRVTITPRASRPAPATNLAALKAFARPAADAAHETVTPRHEARSLLDRDEPMDNIFSEECAVN